MGEPSLMRPYYKPTFLILISILLIIGICLFLFLPRSTPISISITMVKLDAEGNQIGTAEFVMTGAQKDYLFKDSRLDVTFSVFEDPDLLNNVVSHLDGIAGRIFDTLACDFRFIYPFAYDSETNSLYAVTLAFSKDYDYLLLANNTTKEYYYACVSGSATTEELIEYFAPYGVKNTLPAK